MADFNSAARWLDKAIGDMKSAEILLREGIWDYSCYHAQQAGEKILKGYLSLVEDEPAYTHNVGELCKNCIDYDQDFKDILGESSDLTYYATHTRYPGDESFTERDAKEAIENAQRIYNFAFPRIQTLSEELPEQFGPTLSM